MVRGIRTRRPMDGSSPVASNYQMVMVALMLVNGFIGMALGATIFCGETCSAISPEYSLMSSSLFFGATAICAWQAFLEDKKHFNSGLVTTQSRQIVRCETQVATQFSTKQQQLLNEPETIAVSEDGIYWFTVSNQPKVDEVR